MEAWIFLLFSLSVISKISEGREADTHIVYFGNVDKSLHANAITDSHHELLESILGSQEAARESLGFSYKHGFNGFSAHLSEEQAAKISRLPNVLSVFPNRNYELHTTDSWEFLGLYGEQSLFGASEFSQSSYLWKKTEFGKDIVIGVLDSGVWPESESFSDHGMEPIPKSWKGTCESGEQFNSSHCNRKLIGARFFTSALIGGPESYAQSHQEVLSPRDVNGHGTHVASIAGGRPVRNADWFGYAPGTIVGGAPNSRLAIYKVCWRNITENIVICQIAHVLAAFDMGIHDGVDVFSLSIGGLDNYFVHPTSIGAFHAMQKGIVVVASAGNSQLTLGDGSVDNIAPWIITVGASTLDRAFLAEICLGNNKTFSGLSLTNRKLNRRWYPLVSSVDVGLKISNFSARQLCFPGSLDRNKVRGKIVACLRGTIRTLVMSEEVLRAGGAGMIVYNSIQDYQTDPVNILPYIDVDAKATRAIFLYMNSTSSPVATIQHQITERNIKPAPVMALFSSTGPSSIDPNILKPDITAPGVNILAAYTQFNNSKTKFAFSSGTSMSCPHVTGIVALLKSYRPSWSPAAIKSALVTTAYPFDNTGEQIKNATLFPATPFQYGGGHINPNAAAHPGLVYDADEKDYISYLCGLGYNQTELSILTQAFTKCPENAGEGLNYPSISISNLLRSKVVYREVTNVDDDATIYKATVEEPSGVSVLVDPPVLEFSHKGEKKKFRVIFRVENDSSLGAFTYGKLQWSNGKYKVTSPVAVFPTHDDNK